MSHLCRVNEGGDCSNACSIMLVIPKQATPEEMKHEEQACIVVGGGEAGVLGQPNFEEQEGRLSLKNPPSSIEANDAHNDMTEGEDKKLQYALRSNPKKSRRFLDPDQIMSSAAPLASSITVISSITTAAITSTNSEIGAATVALLPSPPPAAPLKKPNSVFSEKARACTECGKQFSSWKALFGHMRCHPERQWRGIQPPSSIPSKQKPKKQGKAPSPISKAPQIECPQSENSRAQAPLHGYLAESDTESIEAAYINERDQESPKAQRGSQSHSQGDMVMSCQFSHSPSPTESEVMDELDMADCLVMLAFAAKAEAATEPSDCNSGQEELGLEVHSGSPLIAAESRVKKRSYSCMQKSIHPFQAKGDKATKYEEDGTWERKSKFECSTCKKQFRSHQALGGHRASHKKVKGCFARTNEPEGASPTQAEEMKTASDEEMMIHMQQEELLDAAEEKRAEQDDTPEHCKMSMGQFLQYSMACHEKIEEDQHDSAITVENKQLKHQSSSCSSSSCIIAATAAPGTLFMHHQHNHHHQQQQLLKIHQCTVCSRVFSTGQALGGHKRCHWGSPNSNQKGTPNQDSDRDCGENPQICLNICSSERSSDMSRKGQQDSSSSAAEQGMVTEMALKQELEPSSKHRLYLSPLGDAKDGIASACNWLVGEYALSNKDLDANKMMLKTGHVDEGGSHVSNYKKYLNGRFSSKIQGTGSSIVDGKAWLGSFLSPKCGESGNVNPDCQAYFYETDANDSSPPKEELLDLNLPAPAAAEDAE